MGLIRYSRISVVGARTSFLAIRHSRWKRVPCSIKADLTLEGSLKSPGSPSDGEHRSVHAYQPVLVLAGPADAHAATHVRLV